MTATGPDGARPKGVLAIVDRGYRGALEKQYLDGLYLALELHRQLGGLDVLLRGSAVTYGVGARPVPALRLGPRTVGTLTDPRAGIRSLLAAGVPVWAEVSALRAHGMGPEHLLEGVRPAEDGQLARHWDEYTLVCHL